MKVNFKGLAGEEAGAGAGAGSVDPVDERG